MAAPVELSVSNICWPDTITANQRRIAHQKAIDMLVQLDVPAIDVAPTKAWPRILSSGPQAIDKQDVSEYVDTLRGRKIAGFQALTYQIPGEIFGDKEGRDTLKTHIRGIIDLAQLAGVRTIIYGSPNTRALPKNRARSEMQAMAADFFDKLGGYATKHDVILGIEPVSRLYVENGFGRSGSEVDSFLSALNNPEGSSAHNPVLVPDRFAMQDSGENIFKTITRAAEGGRLASHWQVSEKGMALVGSKTHENHRAFARALGHIVSGKKMFKMITLAIEMMPDKNQPLDKNIKDIERAVRFVRTHYPVN